MTDETVLVLFKMKKRSLFDSEIENASMNVFLRDENGEPWTKVEQSHQIYHLGGSVNESSSLSAGNFSSDSALGNIRRPNQDRALYDADVSAPESLSWITETTNESTRRRNELQLIRRERHQRVGIFHFLTLLKFSKSSIYVILSLTNFFLRTIILISNRYRSQSQKIFQVHGIA